MKHLIDILDLSVEEIDNLINDLIQERKGIWHLRSEFVQMHKLNFLGSA